MTIWKPYDMNADELKAAGHPVGDTIAKAFRVARKDRQARFVGVTYATTFIRITPDQNGPENQHIRYRVDPDGMTFRREG